MSTEDTALNEHVWLSEVDLEEETEHIGKKSWRLVLRDHVARSCYMSKFRYN